MSGLVSVVMPAYNAEKFIASALASILSQSYSDLEVIVVDDGSGDGTPDIVHNIARRDPRVKYFRQSNSRRPACARNAGISRAAGEFICFLDADDLYEREKVQACLDVFGLYSGCGLVFHDVRNMNEEGALLAGTYLRNVDFLDHIKGEAVGRGSCHALACDSHSLFYFMCMNVTTILTSSVMLKRDVLLSEETWFSESLVVGEDVDLWFRLVSRYRVAYVDSVLSLYRQYPASVTKSNIARFADSVKSHSVNYRRSGPVLTGEERRRYRERIAGMYFDAGYDVGAHGKWRTSVEMYWRSFLWYPSARSVAAIVKLMVKGTLPATAGLRP